MPSKPSPASLLSLPIDAAIPGVLRNLQASPCLVLKAAPGAGKTTRVPAALLRAPFVGDQQEVLVLEPRRLAAKLAAIRVAEEIGESVGETVGYQFRFENVGRESTRLRFLTEGMLLRRLLSDPELRNVAAVILDEFHERHLHTDLALSFLRKLQCERRPDLKIIVMSATLETGAVAEFLGNCPVVEVEGRQFEVSTSFLPQEPTQFLEVLVGQAVEELVAHPDTQDILVFLPGMAEIRRAQSSLSTRSAITSRNYAIHILHGELSREEQAATLAVSGQRKIILSTNIAETSVTLPRVTGVVDSGLARVASYSWWSGFPSLHTKSISRASAVQRAGRAGRVAPGRCIRLYTKNDFLGRPAFDRPEILRADLTQVLLELLALGIGKVEEFPWFEAPQRESVDAAVELLRRLGALDESGQITPMGVKLSQFPAHPRISRIVVEAAQRGILDAGSRLAAFIAEGFASSREAEAQADVLVAFRKFDSSPAARSFAIRRLSERFAEVGRRSRLPLRPSADEVEHHLARSILSGFPDRVGKKKKNAEFALSGGGSVVMKDETLANSVDYIVAVEIDETRGANHLRSQMNLRSACVIEPEWLFDLEPTALEEVDDLRWDAAKERVEFSSQLRYGQLILSESKRTARSASSDIPQHLSSKITDFLLAQVFGTSPANIAGPLPPAWAKLCDLPKLEMIRSRVDLIRQHRPEFAIDPWTEEYLRNLIKEMALGAWSLADLRESDPVAFFLSQLSAEQSQRLEKWTPSSVTLAKGRRVTVNYELHQPPWIASRLQDFFGMTQGPMILDGQLPLTLHLLAPNQRPVQITRDLRGFWARVYPDLRKELGRRYPRHAWPEDPVS